MVWLSQAAEQEVAKLSKQCETALKTVEQLREEVGALRTNRDEMVLKYRRYGSLLWKCMSRSSGLSFHNLKTPYSSVALTHEKAAVLHEGQTEATP